MGIEYQAEGMPGPGIPEQPTGTDTKENRKNGYIFTAVIIIVFSIIIFDVVRKQQWVSLIRLILYLAIFYVLVGITKTAMESSPEVTQKYLRKIAKWQPIFIIVLLLTLMLAGIDAIKSIASMVFLVALMAVSFTFAVMQQYKHLLVPDQPKNSTIEEKIKSELFLHDVKHFRPAFPKYLNWIGGFMNPLFPFFTVVNKNWEKKLPREAFIHENMHIHLMKYEGWAMYILTAVFVIPIIGYIFGLKEIPLIFFNGFIFAVLLTTHERITFEKTHELAKRFGITTRKWTGKIARKYLIIYSIWFIGLSLLFYGIGKLFTLIGG